MFFTAKGIDQIGILINQNRYKEAEALAREFIVSNPEIDEYKYCLAQALLLQGKLTDADEVADALLEDDPSRAVFIELKARIDIDQERLVDAEDKLKGLLESEYISDSYYLLLAQVKFRQNNYDKSLEYLDMALELDAENLDALNMRTAVANIIGDTALDHNIEEALNMSPNNSYAIANHGTQLLNQGKEKEALLRFKEALAIEPENVMAKYGLLEALKSRFWPYKMLHKYSLMMSRLSGKQSWTFIIGAYLIYRFILRTAQSNPELKTILYPIAGVIILMFLSTWILTPLMNLTLLTNPYGRLLLDEDEKKSALMTGVAFVLMLISAVMWAAVSKVFLFPTCIFLAMMIPAGTMLTIPGKDARMARLFGGALILIGLGAVLMGLLTGSFILAWVYALGLFGYQIMMNVWVIRTQGRTFGD